MLTLPSSQLPAPSSPITLVGLLSSSLSSSAARGCTSSGCTCTIGCSSGVLALAMSRYVMFLSPHYHSANIAYHSQKAADAVSVSVSGSPVTTASVIKKTAAAAALVAARAHLPPISKTSGPANFIVSSAASGGKRRSHLSPYNSRFTITLDDFVLRSFHTVDDSDSDSDSDFDLDVQFDGLRVVRSTVDSWIPVRAGSRKVEAEPDVLAPPVLSVSCTANTTLRRTIHVKRPSRTKPKRSSVSIRRNKENDRPIQSPRRALLARGYRSPKKTPKVGIRFSEVWQTLPPTCFQTLQGKFSEADLAKKGSYIRGVELNKV
ncbi:hypothetical protein C8R44DRAFT_741392 [Mycena epipterygia]|nr:hypothetical protein C8R44DRAFT_741392 [Mycena epipterygia]